MDALLMNSENSRTNDKERFILHLSDKLDIKRSLKQVSLSALSIYYTL